MPWRSGVVARQPSSRSARSLLIRVPRRSPARPSVRTIATSATSSRTSSASPRIVVVSRPARLYVRPAAWGASAPTTPSARSSTYLLRTQFNAWQGLLRTPPDLAPIIRAAWVCALYAVPCLAASYLVFLRRDVAGG